MESRWYGEYERVVYRHLKCSRDNEFLDQLNSYVDAALGKSYYFSTWDLLFSRRKDGELHKEEQESYFCSELIACVYKHMGIIDGNASARHYLPGSFSVDMQIPFVSGAALGSEHLLDFNL